MVQDQEKAKDLRLFSLEGRRGAKHPSTWLLSDGILFDRTKGQMTCCICCSCTILGEGIEPKVCPPKEEKKN